MDHDQEVVGSWHDTITTDKNENKGSQMGHTKKYLIQTLRVASTHGGIKTVSAKSEAFLARCMTKW
jgi:hypothetical protein